MSAIASLFPELPTPASRGPVILLRAAEFSQDRKMRWTLTRIWDAHRPVLLVVMFNPSDANEQREDPTVSLVCCIADHNGFGGIVITNLVPVVSSKPQAAFDMLDWDKRGPEWGDRDVLNHNLAIISDKASSSGAILIAPGALASRDPDWFEFVLDEIECNAATGTPIYCLGKTKGGYPLHPLARGKLKLRKDAKLIPWKSAPPADVPPIL